MPSWKENGPGGCCCDLCCQGGWDEVLARFTDLEITGPTIPTVNYSLPTSFAIENCGGGAVSRECETTAADKLLAGASMCASPYYVGYARRWTAINSGGCNAVYCEASFAIQVVCVGGVPRYSAQFFVIDRAVGSGKDCNVPGCPVGDFYLPEPVAGGLIYPISTGFGLSDNATPSPTSVPSDAVSSFVRTMWSDGGNCGGQFAVGVPSGSYTQLIDYYYGKQRLIITDDPDDLPTSVTLSPLVNPGGASATFVLT